MRRYRIAVTILFLAAASCLFFLWPREPRFQGRPLSSWLAALDDGTGEKGITWSPNPPVVPTPRQLEAAVAVRGLGAKATTQLLAMLAAGEPVVRTFKEVVRQWSIRLRLAGQPRQVQYERQTPATVMRHRAALGLLALDASARPSVSQLGELFANPELSKEAALVLASLGHEGLSPLIPFIRTNQTSWQAVCAVWALAQFPTNAQPIVPDLLSGLTNSNLGFKQACAWAMARIRADPNIAVAALTNAVRDTQIRYLCLRAIESYGAQASSAVPVLVKVISTHPRSATLYEQSVLKSIDPEAAAKVQAKWTHSLGDL